jgi:predicted phage terminase large subunit-like protein
MIESINRKRKIKRMHLLKWQADFYFNSDIPNWRLLHKGRQIGGTYGGVLSTIVNKDLQIRKDNTIMWVDTSLMNIKRYYYRYWQPLFKAFDIKHRFDKQANYIEFNNCQIDLRTIEAPDKMDGFNYDYIHVNEAGISLKKSDLWEQSIAPMLLTKPDGEVVIQGTPKGKNGFYKLYQTKEFHNVNKTTYDNEALDLVQIQKIKNTMPSTVIKQELYGEFIEQGTLFLPHWFKTYQPLNQTYDRIYMGVDLAISEKQSADYTAISVVGIKDDNIFIIDSDRVKTATNQIDFILEYAKRYRPERIIIESNQFQTYIANELIKKSLFAVQKENVIKDKYTRALPLAAKMELGYVYFNEKLTDLKNELLDFPEGLHDDMVDATTIALNNIDYTDWQVYSL